jgi:hypothetical protein
VEDQSFRQEHYNSLAEKNKTQGEGVIENSPPLKSDGERGEARQIRYRITSGR